MHEVGARLVFIKTSHDIGTTRHANGRSVVVSVKNHTLATKAINVASLNIGIPITGQGVISLVVREKEDDIGPVLSLLKELLFTCLGSTSCSYN